MLNSSRYASSGQRFSVLPAARPAVSLPETVLSPPSRCDVAMLQNKYPLYKEQVEGGVLLGGDIMWEEGLQLFRMST